MVGTVVIIGIVLLLLWVGCGTEGMAFSGQAGRAHEHQKWFSSRWTCMLGQVLFWGIIVGGTILLLETCG